MVYVSIRLYFNSLQWIQNKTSSSGGSAFRWSVSEGKRRALLQVTCLSLPFHLCFGLSCIWFDKSRHYGFDIMEWDLTVWIWRQNDAPNCKIGPTKWCIMSVRLNWQGEKEERDRWLVSRSALFFRWRWSVAKGKKRALLPTSHQSLSSFSPCQLWRKGVFLLFGDRFEDKLMSLPLLKEGHSWRHFLFWFHWSKLEVRADWNINQDLKH